MSNLKLWRESASLILAAKSNFSKPSPYNYKLLCLQRSSKSQFMPNTYVFPGGNVSKSDTNMAWLNLYEKFGFNKQSLDDLRPVKNIPVVFESSEENILPKHLSFRICAIRETFEECGILLCKTFKINSNWASFIGGHEFISWQKKVYENPEEFLKMCYHFYIVPDVWALNDWSQWMTPPSNPTSKFNTIFFLATLHQMPCVHRDEKETQDLMWTTPEDCIQMNNKENILLPVPQFYEMSRLKSVLDIDALSAFAKNRSINGYECFWPYRVKTDNGLYTILPGDDLYPEKMDKNDTEISYVGQIPDSEKKNRILHKTKYGNFLEVKNVDSKCNQIVPIE